MREAILTLWDHLALCSQLFCCWLAACPMVLTLWAHLPAVVSNQNQHECTCRLPLSAPFCCRCLLVSESLSARGWPLLTCLRPGTLATCCLPVQPREVHLPQAPCSPEHIAVELPFSLGKQGGCRFVNAGFLISSFSFSNGPFTGTHVSIAWSRGRMRRSIQGGATRPFVYFLSDCVVHVRLGGVTPVPCSASRPCLE